MKTFRPFRGFFCGLSGNESYSVAELRAAAASLSNAAYVNRIAWFFGTRGPSICVDTEESSGAAAMDTALNYQRQELQDMTSNRGQDRLETGKTISKKDPNDTKSS